VGDGGIILHYDGNNWSLMSSGTTDDINGIWGSSSSDIFAVGYAGMILHYDGHTWSPTFSGASDDFNSIWGSSKSDIFAVGRSSIFHYDGRSWTSMNSGNQGGINGMLAIIFFSTTVKHGIQYIVLMAVNSVVFGVVP
jgi:hypothetical protein